MNGGKIPLLNSTRGQDSSFRMGARSSFWMVARSPFTWPRATPPEDEIPLFEWWQRTRFLLFVPCENSTRGQDSSFWMGARSSVPRLLLFSCHNFVVLRLELGEVVQMNIRGQWTSRKQKIIFFFHSQTLTYLIAFFSCPYRSHILELLFWPPTVICQIFEIDNLFLQLPELTLDLRFISGTGVVLDQKEIMSWTMVVDSF